MAHTFLYCEEVEQQRGQVGVGGVRRGQQAQRGPGAVLRARHQLRRRRARPHQQRRRLRAPPRRDAPPRAACAHTPSVAAPRLVASAVYLLPLT